MTYIEMKDYLTKRMRMSHIYQPVMIKRLLESNGRSTDTEIAAVLVYHDQSQVEYYRAIVNNMVGKVLRNHKVVEMNEKMYFLAGFESITLDQRLELISLCDNRISQYIDQRGKKIWAHRDLRRNYVPGTVRYEVLKRAAFRCELCGISADDRALEVDHIVPISRHGVEDIVNYQALCYVCNASKNNRDDYDLRLVSKAYSDREDGCIFCNVGQSEIVESNALAIARTDKYPVVHGHSLVIPKRHIASYFELTQAELNATSVP